MSGKRLIDVMMADHHNGTQAMPNKYPEKKGWDVPKQKYKVSNWADYNESLRLYMDSPVLQAIYTDLKKVMTAFIYPAC